MDWLDRARRELTGCTGGSTAVAAVGNPSAASAVQPGVARGIQTPSFGSIGSGQGRRFPDEAALQEEYEERAGILEFDGGLSRAEAERLAWELIAARHTVH